ncbi:adenylate/guanylate cyclase domain-containing protein [uncultured Fibrobacter sp.]|uniref:adenylate/guanylate cyclase domain-containing protein n=1 Tax=uncultured Fibrobacter sp. TaxID=261512 RepID=UPI0025FD9F8A|nr:adenylate/guanylate cyclase domain-containing protein [uncultured Fibrobacter sp.]MBR3669152.1 adenylate/guanylate cyclase domain-containing protein [Fibrobacter sp.]
MFITRVTARKFKAICNYIAGWVIVMVGASALGMFAFGSFSIDRLFFILQLSMFVGLSHGIYDVVVLQDEMDHRSVSAALLIRSFYFVANISINYALCILIWDMESESGRLITAHGLSLIVEAFSSPKCHATIALMFLLAHMFTFLNTVHKKFGARVFVNTILGKYQDPVEEDLIFMFIDLRHSTELAEELGHVKYSSFMKDYYKLLSNCCAENRGDIYQIAGDGAFLTWKTSSCKKKARPINCFYDFAVCLERTRPRFLKKYGVAPTFKAGAHCGKVISTEVGNFGSEMAYHGDVLNTTSRIQSLCTKLGKDFLISEDLYIKLPLPLPHEYFCHKEGFFELRGKKKEILIFSIHTP